MTKTTRDRLLAIVLAIVLAIIVAAATPACGDVKVQKRDTTFVQECTYVTVNREIVTRVCEQ